MELSVISSLDEVHQIRSYWESVQGHPNVHLEHFRLICGLRREVIRPHIAVISRGGKPTALLIGRLERTTFSPTVGYLTPVEIPARLLRIVYQGALGDVALPEANAFIDHLWQVLRGGGADAVELFHVPESSALLEAFRTRAPRLWSQRRMIWAKHWSLNLPPEVGDLTKRMRSKHRNWLRKKDRELEEAFPGRVCWRWATTFDSLAELCERLEAVAARTYQRGLGAGFRNDEDHRRRFELFARQGELRLKLLEIDGAIRAFWLGTLCGGVFHSWATAYDPELRQYEPGNNMFHRLVDDLIREGVHRLDFGLGDAFYKERFGDASWNETTVRFFAPTARGALLRGSLGVSSALDRAGRRILEATGRADRLKTFWRRRIAGGDSRRSPASDRSL